MGLRFGDIENIKDVIEKIAHREGIYSELANGSKWLSEKYGGKEFAIHAKGLKLASYEPRQSVGMGLGYATANRGGCHLNGGYLALVESVGVLSVDRNSQKGKAEMTIFFQNMMEAISAAGFCLFTAQAVIHRDVPALLESAFAVGGAVEGAVPHQDVPLSVKGPLLIKGSILNNNHGNVLFFVL